MTDFKHYVGCKRKSGTGCVSEINDHLLEGFYSPPSGPTEKARPRCLRSYSRGGKERLKVLIVEVKADIVEAQRLKDMGEGDGWPPDGKKGKQGKHI